MPVTITEVRSTERFVGTPELPRQVLHVTIERSMRDGEIRLEVTGTEPPGSVFATDVRGALTVPAGDRAVRVDVPLDLPERAGVGDEIAVRVSAASDGGDEADAYGTVVVAEAGWTMVMVSHFHYDPVWWNTQASYTTDWDFVGPDWSTRPAFVDNGFALVEAHLKLAVRDPDYHFVLAELDYLKPYFDTYPEQRAVLRRLLAEGRVELVGGTYNEPNTNLTGSETTIRNFVYGIGFQRDILGGDPQTAWQLDAFGHDPQFPGLAAKAGLTGSAWARGPHHQWGPLRQHWDQDRTGDITVMQFESEFEWISPSGDGVLTHYMPDHYGPGWELQHAPSVEAAGDIAYHLFQVLKPVAATRNTLLPVGGDYCPPNNWVTELHRWWNDNYVWPRFVCGTTRMFMDRVRDGTRRAAPDTLAAEPRHEPGLHRQGRLLHRHEAGAARRRDGRHRRREADDVRRPARRGTVPGGRPRQGLAAAGLRRAPRRDHRLRGRPGLHRPAHRLARGLRPGRRRPRRRVDGDRGPHRHDRRGDGAGRPQHRRVRPHRPGARGGRDGRRRPRRRRHRRRGARRRRGAGRRAVRGS